MAARREEYHDPIAAENRETAFDADALQAKLDATFAQAQAHVAALFGLKTTVDDVQASARPLEVRPPSLGLGAHPSDAGKNAQIDDRMHGRLVQEARKRRQEAVKAAPPKRKVAPTAAGSSDSDSDQGESRARSFSKKVALRKDAFKPPKLPARTASTPPVSIPSTATSLASPPPVASTSKQPQLQEDEYMHSSFDEGSNDERPPSRGTLDRPKIPYAPLQPDSDAEEPDPSLQEQQRERPRQEKAKAAPLLNLDGPVQVGGALGPEQRKKKKRKKKRKSSLGVPEVAAA